MLQSLYLVAQHRHLGPPEPNTSVSINLALPCASSGVPCPAMTGSKRRAIRLSVEAALLQVFERKRADLEPFTASPFLDLLDHIASRSMPLLAGGRDQIVSVGVARKIRLDDG
jgi:hypothetical protein